MDCSTRLPCPSPSPRVCSNSCLLSWWCHPTISPSVAPFSSCPQSFPVPGPFPMSWLFTSGGQSVGASASVLPMNIQSWFPLGLTGFISLQSKGLSRVFSSTTVQKHQFLALSLLYGPTLIYVLIMDHIVKIGKILSPIWIRPKTVLTLQCPVFKISEKCES